MNTNTKLKKKIGQHAVLQARSPVKPLLSQEIFAVGVGNLKLNSKCCQQFNRLSLKIFCSVH